MSVFYLIGGIWVLCLVAIVALLGYLSHDMDLMDDMDAPEHVSRREWARVAERRR